MSGNSSVGTSGVYEAGDQRNLKNSEIPTGERYNEGKEHSHLANDSSRSTFILDRHLKNSILTSDTEDERSIANRLAAEEKKSEPADDPETAMSKKDATLPVSFE